MCEFSPVNDRYDRDDWDDRNKRDFWDDRDDWDAAFCVTYLKKSVLSTYLFSE